MKRQEHQVCDHYDHYDQRHRPRGVLHCWGRWHLRLLWSWLALLVEEVAADG